MKCLIWNVRGAGRACFTSSIKTLVSNHCVDIGLILEPSLSCDRAIKVAWKLCFKNIHLEEAQGFLLQEYDQKGKW